MSSLALDPMDRVMRKMVVLSAGLHALGAVLGAGWTHWREPVPRFLPVAVVDLVGAGPSAPREPSPPAAAENGSALRPPPPAKASKAPQPAAAAKAPPARQRAQEPAPAPALPDARALSERIRSMREERATSEQVREAVGTIRRERDARSAIHRIGERVAHRVDLSGLRPAPAGTTPAQTGAVPGGAAGAGRVSPETLAYFRELDERIRSKWTVPDLAVADPGSLIVQIRITIEMDGKASNVRMERSSGNSYFDDSVLRAIRRASPLPVPPEQLRGAEDHYEVGFRFFGSGEGS
jgi:TonB family protein